MTLKRQSRRRGLTMIEVMVSSVILFMIVAMSSWLVWTSSKHVTNSEVTIQMDAQLRDLLGTMSNELRMTRAARVSPINSVTIKSDKATLAAAGVNTPGTGTTVAAGTPFYAIRFRIPGSSMEITKDNAAAFDVSAFNTDANTNNPNWTTEIMYWWEPDVTVGEEDQTHPPTWANNNAPDGKDNNLNGIVDEGVIKRMETTFNVGLGSVKSRNVSTIARGVQVSGPGKVGLTFTNLPIVVADPPNGIVSQNANRFQITITLERVDPTNVKRTIVRQMTSIVEMRNN